MKDNSFNTSSDQGCLKSTEYVQKSRVFSLKKFCLLIFLQI